MAEWRRELVFVLAETERIIHQDIEFLPLKSYTNIREGNALRMDWDVIEKPSNIPVIHAKNVHLIIEPEPMIASESVVEYDEVNVVTSHFDGEVKPSIQRYQVHYDFIMGNPPFVGYSLQSDEQKDDILRLFVDRNGKSFKTAGKIDYVAGWYYKAAQLMNRDSVTRTALVSTNSITQGEQVAAIWKPLKEMFGIHIDFAYRTFRWDSEATQKAHVHCVIIGISKVDVPKYIYENDKFKKVENINAYLIDAPDVFVESRKEPICDVPAMRSGGKPVEGGNLIFTDEEKAEFIKNEPKAKTYMRQFIGSDDFINGHNRWCLWLLDASPNELRSMPMILSRIEKVRKYRLSSKKEATRKCAETPARFMEIKQSIGRCLVIPEVSSEKRKYIPIGFVEDAIYSNLVRYISGISYYHFGILISIVHMAWMRVACGRLEMRYRYSANVVYNNFPWPNPTDEQKAKIEQTAQAILDARAKYPDSSLADLYDELTMPAELRKAHKDNDRAVMQAYGFSSKITEDQESLIVAELFKMYQELTK